MEVKLISITEDAEKIIEMAGRKCWDSDPDEEKRSLFIRKLIKRGHTSVLEHASVTFDVTGVSRALLAQITRHRVGVSFSVRSQRYVKEDNFCHLIPDSILYDKKALKTYLDLVVQIKECYGVFLKMGIKPEDARAILPNACQTEFIVTFNMRSLRHFLGLRLDPHAQKEIRELSGKFLDLVRPHCPNIFNDFS